jgi:hypothetical protein
LLQKKKGEVSNLNAKKEKKRNKETEKTKPQMMKKKVRQVNHAIIGLFFFPLPLIRSARIKECDVVVHGRTLI